jgi:hypothetical protein
LQYQWPHTETEISCFPQVCRIVQVHQYSSCTLTLVHRTKIFTTSVEWLCYIFLSLHTTIHILGKKMMLLGKAVQMLKILLNYYYNAFYLLLHIQWLITKHWMHPTSWKN